MEREELWEVKRDPDREVGRPYAGWREGEFDVHLIDVGIAEASFHIYPDGATALVDCGDRDPTSRGNSGRGPRPSGARRPGEWVARYLARLCPGRKTIDYLVATHFHKDHVGSAEFGAGMTTGRGSDYQLSGLSQVGERYRFGVALDRGFPDYAGLSDKSRREADNLRRFLAFQEREFGLRREAFRVGAADQIRLTIAPERYDFHTRNVCGNGLVWTGKGTATVDLIEQNGLGGVRSELENTQSLGIAFRYGPYRFFTGGDVMNAIVAGDVDFESAIARAIGPQDVCKANHHASRGSMTRGFTTAVRARAYLVNVWQDGHLRTSALEAMGDDSATGYPGVRLICPVACPAARAEQAEKAGWGKYLVVRSGHVVAKAYAGGAKFKIYYLTSEDESMRVDAVFGPFTSRLAEG